MPALKAVPHTVPLSEQAEQLHATARRQYADLATVERYADQIEGTGVDICRERGGRHRYPKLPRSAPFDTSTSGGYLIRRTDPCLDCGAAYQVQRYEPYETRQGRKRIIRVRPAYNTTEYLTRDDGVEYLLPPGQGYVHPRDYRDVIATIAVHSDPGAQALALVALEQRTKVLAQREARKGKH